MSAEAMLRELKKVSKILILAHASSIQKELDKVANTNDRKKMWVLIDGKRLANEIAKEAGVNPSTMSRFLDSALAADLVEYIKGEPPRRVLDYVPPLWIDLVMAKSGEEPTEPVKNVEDKGIKEQMPISQTSLLNILAKKDNQHHEEKATDSPDTKNASSESIRESS